jgi:hypothetical protein
MLLKRNKKDQLPPFYQEEKLWPVQPVLVKVWGGTIIRLWIHMDWMSSTKMHLSGHIWCRWCGCVFQFGHWDKCLKIKPYWSDPLLCHDQHGFWNQLTLKVVHGPDRTGSPISLSWKCSIENMFCKTSVFMAFLRLRSVAKQEEKIYCALFFMFWNLHLIFILAQQTFWRVT